MTDRACLHCKATLTSANPRARYCDSTCRARACEARMPARTWVKPCKVCGNPLEVRAKSASEPTCHDCRRERRQSAPKSPKDYTYKKVPCAACGEPAWKSPAGQGSRDGKTYHRNCPRPGTAPRVVERACAWCLDIFLLKYPTATHCSPSCAQRHAASKRGRSQTRAGRARRSDRERIAPGLTYTQRRALLHQWRKSGTACVYCTSPATTVDHVIPLARGGTNYEGNLVPCCKRCNSSKSDLLTSEWRWGKRSSGSVSYSPWLATALHRVRRPKVVTQRTPPKSLDCYVCGTRFAQRMKTQVVCGGECSTEHAKRSQREAYRAKVGLPPTWSSPIGEAWSRKRVA